MTMSHGGRVTNVLEAAPPPPPEGIILPPVRRVNDTSGRIFLFFVDDLHLQFQNSGRVRELFKKIVQEARARGRSVRHRLERALVDRHRHDLRPQAARRCDQEDCRQRPEAERDHQPRHRFAEGRPSCATARTSRSRRCARRSTISRRCTIAARRSSGSAKATTSTRSRIRGSACAIRARRSCRISPAAMQNTTSGDGTSASDRPDDPEAEAVRNVQRRGSGVELGEITRAANRANTTIYTIDPRGLVAGSDIDEQVDPRSGTLRAEVAGQHARAGRGDRRPRGRQHERLRQGAEADRRGEQRLLRARLLLEQPRSDQAPPQDRGQGGAARISRSSPARSTCSSPRSLRRLQRSR